MIGAMSRGFVMVNSRVSCSAAGRVRVPGRVVEGRGGRARGRCSPCRRAAWATRALIPRWNAFGAYDPAAVELPVALDQLGVGRGPARPRTTPGRRAAGAACSGTTAVAPAAAIAATVASIDSSVSVRPGRIGAISTVTSKPASANRRTASSRRRGLGVPGSTERQSASSTKPTEKLIPTRVTCGGLAQQVEVAR